MLPVRRVSRALRLSLWSVALLVIAIFIAAGLVLHRGDAEGAARLANREIDLLLEPDEVVEVRVPVMQRRWWTFFRVTHGVLAATDRRLIYVGVPPEELLRHEPEPPILYEGAWRYEWDLDIRRQRVFLGARPGVSLAANGVRESFAVRSTHVARLDSVVAATQRRRAALRDAQEAERRAIDVALEAARQPIHHVVGAGETLTMLARRYGTSVDSLRRWNTLTDDRLAVGARLLVRPGQ